MTLPLLLLALSPAEAADEYPEPPSPCQITWAPEISTRFAKGATPRIERRCREYIDAADKTFPPGSIMLEIGGETAAFTTSVTLKDGDDVVYELPADDEVCECGGGDLSTFAMRRVANAIERYESSQQEPDLPKFEPDPPVTTTVPDDTATKKPIKPIGPLGIAGVVVGAVGLGGVATGLVLLPREDVERFDPSTTTGIERTTYRTPAIIALAAGGAALIGGTAMLVTDVVRRKKKHRASATLAPSLTPQGAGLTLTGTF